MRHPGLPGNEGDAQRAFENAVACERLQNRNPYAPLYAGEYMWMGVREGRDLFKHRMTREYLP